MKPMLWRAMAGRLARRGREPANDPVGHAITLSRRLISRHGEVHGTRIAVQLADAVAAMDDAMLSAFFSFLVVDLAPDAEALGQAAEQYLEERTVARASAITRAAEPPRQELLRRLNMAPGGTRLILALRERLIAMRQEQPELDPLDQDFAHLLASWFNRGFLRIERIDWNTPAAILERLIRYEAVHAIAGWDDLRHRLTGARRCFGFFHPALPGEPLIFIEVALTCEISESIAPLLALDGEGDDAVVDGADTAIFYSISNCQPGLRNIPFGNLLIKQVVADLIAELPHLSRFSTLSPIPGFRRWLIAGEKLNAEELATLLAPHWWEAEGVPARLRERLIELCALYLTDGSARDPVAKFHLANGARLERLCWLADCSKKGMADSFGLMVNYRYVLDEVEANHASFMTEGRVAHSDEIAALLADSPHARHALGRWRSALAARREA